MRQSRGGEALPVRHSSVPEPLPEPLLRRAPYLPAFFSGPQYTVLRNRVHDGRQLAPAH